MKRLVVLAVFAAGCFDKPGRPDGIADDDGGIGAAGVTVTRDGTGQKVIDMPGGLQIVFADESSHYAFPVGMTFSGGANAIADASQACATEQRVGIATYPVYQISGVPSFTSGATHALDEHESGPARVLLTTRWSYTHASACMNGRFMATGFTDWAFFPDGRIMRRDSVNPSTDGTPTSDATCACAAGAALTITSFWNFARDGVIASLTKVGDSTEGETGVSGGATGRAGGCIAREDGGRVAVYWAGTSSASMMNPTRIRGVEGRLAFVYDWESGITSIGTNPNYEQATLMQMSHDPAGQCPTMLRHLEAVAARAPLSIGSTSRLPDDLGVYDDAYELPAGHASPVTIRATDGSVESGFAIRINFPGASEITTDAPNAADVIWQKNADESFVIWFRQRLETNATITITPR